MQENIMKVEGKHDFTEDKWLLSDYVTYDPVFSTYTQSLTVIPELGPFHVMSALPQAEATVTPAL